MDQERLSDSATVVIQEFIYLVEHVQEPGFRRGFTHLLLITVKPPSQKDSRYTPRTMGIVSLAVRWRQLNIDFQTEWQIRLSVETSQRHVLTSRQTENPFTDV